MVLPLTDEQAEALLDENNPSPSLRLHGRAVRGVLRHFARAAGEDEAWWAQVGLLHDIDYERFPDEHCQRAPEILRAAGYGDDFIHAVISHGWGLCDIGDDAEPTAYMEKVLYATDELTGLITAAVYMRPDRSVHSIEPKSVRKKFKNKKFAAKIERDVITRGAEMLGLELNDLIAGTIAGMREVAAEIGLEGQPQPTGTPTEEPTGAPTEEPVGVPTEEPVGAPTEEPTGEDTAHA